MNTQSLRKIATICLLLISCFEMQTSFAAQVPLVLQSKLTRLLHQLDTAKKLTPELAAESQDLIKHLQRFDANNEVQRIQKRLSHLSPLQLSSSEEAEKKEAAEVPLLVEEPAEKLEQKQTPNFSASLGNIMNFMKLNGKAATQRVRNFIPPAAGGIATVAFYTILLAPFTYRLYRSLDINTNPFISENICSSNEPTELSLWFMACLTFPLSIATWAVLTDLFLKAIVEGNVQRVRDIIRLNSCVSVDIANPMPFLPIRWSGDGTTPLMLAAVYGQPESAKLLLDMGADIRRTDFDGQTLDRYLQVTEADSPELRKGKFAVRKVILEHQLQKKAQQRLKGLYEPAEIVAAEAIEALHTSMYGRTGVGQAQDIAAIVGSYLTPTYVNMRRGQYPSAKIVSQKNTPTKKPELSEEKRAISCSYEKGHHYQTSSVNPQKASHDGCSHFLKNSEGRNYERTAG